MFLAVLAEELVVGHGEPRSACADGEIVDLLGLEAVIKRVSFSRKAIAYGEESLENKILYVTEYAGGKEAQYLLRILQSEGELAHEYTTGSKTDVTRRIGSPVVLTSTTEDNIFEDDATRFLTIRIDETSAQSLAVLKAELAGEKEAVEPPVEVWQQAIRLLTDRNTKPFSFPSWFEFIAEQVPLEKVRARRDWKRALALIEAVALCRSGTNPAKEITLADYCVAYRILNTALTATAYGLNENELRLQDAVTRLNKELGRAVTIKEVRNDLGWQASMTYKYVRQAVKSKLVRYQDGAQEKNVKRLIPIPGASGSFLPSPRLVLQNVKELPSSVQYIDPLTGEVAKLTRRQASAA